VRDPRIEAVLPLIAFETGPELESAAGVDAMPATVRVVLRDGRTCEATVREPYGDPRKPLTTPMRRAKFEQCAQHVLAAGALGQAWELLERLEQAPDLAPILALLVPGEGAA